MHPRLRCSNHTLSRVRARIAYAPRFFLTLALALAVVNPAPALAWRSATDRVGGVPLSAGVIPYSVAPDIDARAGILVSSDGRVLWSRGGDRGRAMASTTKMMTALLVIEKGGLDRVTTVSWRASKVPYALGLKSGERITVRRLLALALVASSNDAAYALAEYVSGTMPAFVRKMNARASQLGLNHTHFANPHGLDATGHYSSPSDLAKLARVALKRDEFRTTVASRIVRMPAYKGRPARTYKSTDLLLGVYPGIQGVKTGFTGNAGYCFVAYAKRDAIGLTAVILGAASNKSRFAQSARLMDWGFRQLTVQTLATEGAWAARIPSTDPSVTVPARYAHAARVRVFAPDGRVVKKVVADPVELPVFAGQPLGEVRWVQGDRQLAAVPALASTSSVDVTLGAIPVANYVDRSIIARTGEITSTPAFDPKLPVTRTVQIAEQVQAPVAKGERLGEIIYAQGDTIVVRVPIVAAEGVDQPSFVENLKASFVLGFARLTGGTRVASLRTAGS